MSDRPAGDFKTTYVQDMAILDTRFYRVGFVCLLGTLALAPLWLGRFIFVLNAIGIFAIGAYASALLTQAWRLPFIVALPLATAITFVCGIVVGLPSLRIKGLYLAIATLAFQFLTEYAIIHATGGIGAISVAPASIFGWTIRTERQFYYLLLVVWVTSAVFAANLVRRRDGLTLRTG